MNKQIKLQGVQVGSKAMFERMNNAIAGANLRPMITRVFSFLEAREALSFLEKGNAFGKVCLKIS